MVVFLCVIDRWLLSDFVIVGVVVVKVVVSVVGRLCDVVFCLLNLVLGLLV